MQTVAKRLNPMQHVATCHLQLSPRSRRDMRMLANSIDTRVEICRAPEDARGHEAAAWRRFPHQDRWPATSRSRLRCCPVHRHPGARCSPLPFLPPATPESRLDLSKHRDGGHRVVCSHRVGDSSSRLIERRRRKSARSSAERPIRVDNDAAAAGLVVAPGPRVGTLSNLPRGFQP
jgi:hypothetical protein